MTALSLAIHRFLNTAYEFIKSVEYLCLKLKT
jgi:hypothetical protein